MVHVQLVLECAVSKQFKNNIFMLTVLEAFINSQRLCLYFPLILKFQHAKFEIKTKSLKKCIAGIVTTSTCGSTLSTNTTYIRNPGYPSSYTPSSAGTCTYTFSKVSDDICQLRLDFQTFSGFTTTTPAGACSDTFAAAGQTGSDPPSICGTNTDYHSKFLLLL